MTYYEIKQKGYVKTEKKWLPRIRLVKGVWQTDTPKDFRNNGALFMSACFYAHAKNIEEGRYERNS